jgi:hypothetical protein
MRREGWRCDPAYSPLRRPPEGAVTGRWATPSTWGAAGEGTRLSGKRNRLERVTWKPAAVIAVRVSRLVWHPGQGRPDQIHQLLGPRRGRGVGSDMLEEAELTARPEYQVELGERLGLVGHRTQHQRDDGRVHACVCRRERGGGAV